MFGHLAPGLKPLREASIQTEQLFRLRGKQSGRQMRRRWAIKMSGALQSNAQAVPRAGASRLTTAARTFLVCSSKRSASVHLALAVPARGFEWRPVERACCSKNLAASATWVLQSASPACTSGSLAAAASIPSRKRLALRAAARSSSAMPSGMCVYLREGRQAPLRAMIRSAGRKSFRDVSEEFVPELANKAMSCLSTWFEAPSSLRKRASDWHCTESAGVRQRPQRLGLGAGLLATPGRCMHG